MRVQERNEGERHHGGKEGWGEQRRPLRVLHHQGNRVPPTMHHEGKLRALKSAATTLKALNSAPKREACSTKYIGKDAGGGKDRRSGQARHSSTRTHLYLFIYR